MSMDNEDFAECGEICCNCKFVFYRSERSVNNYGASNYGCECLNENNEIHGRGIFVHSTDTCKYFKSADGKKGGRPKKHHTREEQEDLPFRE